ncbi:MAG: hypothetical protein RL172_375, partial [Bacteroidota bacterium]
TRLASCFKQAYGPQVFVNTQLFFFHWVKIKKAGKLFPAFILKCVVFKKYIVRQIAFATLTKVRGLQ